MLFNIIWKATPMLNIGESPVPYGTGLSSRLGGDEIPRSSVLRNEVGLIIFLSSIELVVYLYSAYYSSLDYFRSLPRTHVRVWPGKGMWYPQYPLERRVPYECAIDAPQPRTFGSMVTLSHLVRGCLKERGA